MPFDPSNLATLAAWFKADAGVYSNAGTTLATAGGSVQQWNDQSGLGNHATQSTSGSRPTYQTNQVNSLPCVRFDGTSSYMNSPWLGLPYTFSALVRNNNSSGWHGLAGGNKSGASIGAYYIQTCSDYQVSGHAYHPQRFVPCTSVDLAGTDDAVTCGGRITGSYYVLTGRINGSFVELYVNGALVGQQAYTGTLTTAINLAVIGADFFGGSVVDKAQIDLVELVLCSGAESDANLLALNGYMMARGGVASWLAPGGLGAVTYLNFNADERGQECLQALTSRDGLVWQRVNVGYQPASGEVVRDPSPASYSGSLWFAHTNKGHSTGATTGGFPFNTTNSFSLAKSTDGGLTYSKFATIDCSSLGVHFIWAPEFYQDPASGTWYIFFAAVTSTTSAALYYVTPTLSNWSTWSAPTAVSLTGGPVCPLDPFLIKSGSTYYLWYSDFGGNNGIQKATATSVTGPYTQATSGDWAGWVSAATGGSGGNAEGPSLYYDSARGVWRAYFDAYLYSADTRLGLFWSESSDLTSWTKARAVNAPRAVDQPPRHGSVATSGTLPVTGGRTSSNGSAANLTFGTTNPLSGATNSLTCCWVSATSLPASQRLFSQDNGSNVGWWLGAASDGASAAYSERLGGVASGGTIPNAGWVHVGGLHDGSGSSHLYVNGVDTGTSAEGVFSTSSDQLTVFLGAATWAVAEPCVFVNVTQGQAVTICANLAAGRSPMSQTPFPSFYCRFGSGATEASVVGSYSASVPANALAVAGPAVDPPPLYASASTSLSASADSSRFRVGPWFVSASNLIISFGSGRSVGSTLVVSAATSIALGQSVVIANPGPRFVSAATGFAMTRSVSAALAPGGRLVGATTHFALAGVATAISTGARFVSAATALALSQAAREHANLRLYVSAATTFRFKYLANQTHPGPRAASAATTVSLATAPGLSRLAALRVAATTRLVTAAAGSEAGAFLVTAAGGLTLAPSSKQNRGLHVSATTSLLTTGGPAADSFRRVAAAGSITLHVSAAVTRTGTLASSTLTLTDLAQAVVWLPWRRAPLARPDGGNLAHS